MVNATQALADSFVVVWSRPERANGLLRRYVLLVDNVEVYRGLSRQAEVLGLQPFTQYELRVQVCSEDPCSAMINCATSAVASAVTAAGPPADQPLPTLTVRSATSIELVWSAPAKANGVITRYQVLRTEAVVYDGAAATFVDEGLDPNTRYSYRVRAFNAAGSTTSSLVGFRRARG